MSKRNVLIVDDEHIILKSISRLLGSDDIKIYTCNSYSSAMEIFFHHNIELVIADIMLENHDPLYAQNGIALMTEMKSFKDVPVFVISSNRDYLIEAKYHGADEIFDKPIDHHQISVLVNHYLKKSSTKE